VLDIFLFILGVYKDIIKVYNIVNVKKVKENRVNITLEDCRYISKTKRYYYILKVVISSLKGSFLFIPFLNLDLVVYIL
jgi:hypothetical protein